LLVTGSCQTAPGSCPLASSNPSDSNRFGSCAVRDTPVRRVPPGNGPSFIARRFRDFVPDAYSRVRIVYRTPQQLGVLERFHETLKTEEVYWRLDENPQHARACLAEFLVRYDSVSPHWELVPDEGGDQLVPAEVHRGGRTIQIPRWQDWARAERARLERVLEEVA
jgi:hypothetical protein